MSAVTRSRAPAPSVCQGGVSKCESCLRCKLEGRVKPERRERQNDRNSLRSCISEVERKEQGLGSILSGCLQC